MSIYTIRALIGAITHLARVGSKMWTNRVPKLVQAFGQHIVAASREMLHMPMNGF